MNRTDKPLVWREGEIKTPPFSPDARVEAGMLLRRLQRGENIGLPHSRQMSKTIGKRCHELRIQDENVTWRIIYRIDSDAIIIGEIFAKKDRNTPKKVIESSKKRFKDYDQETA